MKKALATLLFLWSLSFSLFAESAFTKINYKIKGTWSLQEQDGKQVIVIDEAFKTKNAPDLKIFLSPLPIEEVTNKNATTDSAFVAELKRAA